MKFQFNDLLLRSTEGSGLDFIVSLETNSENARFIIPWPREKHLEALENPDILHFLIVNNGEPIGFLVLGGIKNPNQSVEFVRIVIGRKAFGFGRKALRAVKTLSFETLGAHRLWLDVKTFNHRAKNLYLSEGFIEEGTIRDCIKTEEGYESLHILSMLEAEYKGAIL